MSLAAASSGAPEAKKFRFSLPTQVVVNEFDFEKNQRNININGINDVDDDRNEMHGDETTVYENGSENGLDLSSSSKLSPSSLSSGNNNIKREMDSPSPSLLNSNNNNNNNISNLPGLPSGVSYDLPLAMLLQQASAVMKVRIL